MLENKNYKISCFNTNIKITSQR